MTFPSRKPLLYLLILAVALACGPVLSTPVESGPTTTPTPSGTHTPTPIPSLHGQIAYGSSTFTGDSQVVLMDLESGTVTSLTGGYEGEYYRPVWSPDGSKLAMREEISMDGGGIAMMDVRLEGGRPAGSPPVELVHGFADGPTWSPDGNRVAFVSTRETAGWTAYTVDLPGSEPVQLPGIPQHSTDLAWSPDGAWIAFSYYEDSPHQIKDIYLIHPDGTGLTRLTNTPDADEDGPAWSPDSRQIAFSGRSRAGTVGERNLYRINVDGSGLTQITDAPGSEFDPAWSPDGTQLAFTSTRDEINDGNYEIYIINVDGTGERRLTNNLSTDRWPTWRTAPQGTEYGSCNPSAQFAADVTVPAGTRFPGPQEFTKVWKIRNSGNCAWSPTGYGLRFADGEAMGGAAYLPLPGAIQPGDTVDLSLGLTAPAAPGNHSGAWVLFDNHGVPVPGPDGRPLTLTASIDVTAPSSAVLPAPLYFLSERSGSRQIWRMETDGKTLVQITNEPGPVDSYALSPADGSVAYVSLHQLLIVRRDGTDRRIVADFGEGYGGAPAWSPGGVLAYAHEGIRLYDPATGEDRLLRANGSGESMGSIANFSPRVWSPDGSKLMVTIGYYEGAELGILEVGDGSLSGRAPLSEMTAWKNDSSGFFLASASYPEMVGSEPGLWFTGPASGVAPVVSNAFVWWPFHRPDDQLAYFISRPADVGTTSYSVRMAASAADGSGEHILRNTPLELDARDSFTARWAADGTAVVVRIYRPVSQASEVTLIPANDDPPVFLLQEADTLTWETYALA
jgi:Tol biopolymer transport system component